nr:MAG: protein of unknown function DUF4406 [Bacteriophage sp.]
MKVFIPQPTRGLAEREIKLNRAKAIENIKSLYGNDVEIIDNYFDGNEKPLFNLGKSIELLSKADIIYLCKGWNKARGCKIEYMCASDYDIKIIFEEGG